MRHGRKVNHLSRTSSHRKAMLSNMANSLIRHKRINTTLAKAKALRVYVEPLLTKSKDDSTHSRRMVFSYLKDKEIVSELFRDVAPKIAERNGGYTRILKTGNRLGDNAEMCFIELVDFNETYISDKKDKKTTRRSRRGGSKSPSETTPAAEVKKDETPKSEEAPKAEAKTEEAVEVKAEAPKEETPKAETKVEEAKTEEAPKAEAKAEEAPKTEAKAEEKQADTEDKKEGSDTEADEKKDEEKS